MSVRLPEFRTFPPSEHVCYGVPVAAYDGGDGYMVAGQGRRSWAALNAVVRGEYGRRQIDRSRVVARRVWFADECGCTEDQHVEHIADDVDCIEHCDSYGLPPCDDRYGWVANPAKESDPNSMPALEWRP